MSKQRQRVPEDDGGLPMNPGIPPQHMPKIGRFAIGREDAVPKKKGFISSARILHSFNCTFVKPLGWGGEGFAALYEHTRPDGSKRKVVCKARHKLNGNALSLEAATMREFIGSAHTVQPLDPRAFVHTKDGKELPGHSDNQEVLMIEYCARGSFEKVLQETTSGRWKTPPQFLDDLTLWKLFECCS